MEISMDKKVEECIEQFHNNIGYSRGKDSIMAMTTYNNIDTVSDAMWVKKEVVDYHTTCDTIYCNTQTRTTVSSNI